MLKKSTFHAMDNELNNAQIKLLLSTLFDDQVHVLDLCLEATQSLWREPSEQHPHPRYLQFAEMLLGYINQDGQHSDTGYFHERRALDKPIVMILNTKPAHAQHARDTEKALGGEHWLSCVILPLIIGCQLKMAQGK